MTELGATDFDAFFSELWDQTPFQWQRELAERVLTENGAPWPEAIALPTAAGKTACMDIAVFALAAQASRQSRGELITAPRRIFFVVDRRVIVDEAFERAQRLAMRLSSAQDGILKAVADGLRRIARGSEDGFEQEAPLSVHILRGGMYRSEAWARDPLQPTIIASTVDQLGSRMLFRAYGRGPGMWPVYAGLTANDSLILLDEAHCAQPFLQTLQAIGRYRTWATSPLGRGFFPVVMSATPPAGLETFEDTSGERHDPAHPLGRRQLAHKPAALEEVGKAKGTKATAELAKALARAAEGLVDAQRKAVVVFVNRVATARAVFKHLKANPDYRVTLLTGRMRPIDKDMVIASQLRELTSDRSSLRQPSAKPHFVVATQTLEVGADLDFDGLVSECASLDALRQRFGRLNRMGRSTPARAAVLIRGDQTQKSNDDPVYGPALANTWAWLNEQSDGKGEVDFGIAHLEPRLPCGETLLSLNAPAKNAPVMLPAHLDCWVQTSPQPVPSPEVSVFLHGPREGAADIQVCWRADIELERDDKEAKTYALDSLSLCPPSSIESLPLPIHILRRWLAGSDTEDDSSDIEGVNTDENDDTSSRVTGASRRVIRWHGRDTDPDKHITSNSSDIRPGDVIVIPAALGGWNHLGNIVNDPTFPSQIDVADQAHTVARARALLRLHPRLLDNWPDGRARTLASELLKTIAAGDDRELDEATSVREILTALKDESLGWLNESATALLKESSSVGFRRTIRRVGSRAVFVIGQRRLSNSTRDADLFNDEDDASASGIAQPDGHPVRLFRHLPGVANFADRFASGCGMPEGLVDALATAGRLHDIGKADPRFQALLRGGNRWAVGDLLAKSGEMPESRQATIEARRSVGYPESARHELLSVRLAESNPGLLPHEGDHRDLVLHLIASHHGHCRPFAPVVFDDNPPEIRLDFDGQHCQWEGPTRMEYLGSGVTDRFWRLVRRYGWWGLAWLEAVLRLADHRRSEWEETNREAE